MLAIIVYRLLTFTECVADEIEPFAIVEGDLVHIEHKSESVVLTLRGINVTQGSSISKKDSILIHSNENSYQLGNRIKVTGRAFPFERASNPGQFDAYSYYREQGYAYRILADEILLIDDSISHIPQFLQNIKEYYMEAYQMYLPENEAAILIAMVLGNKSLLEEKDRLLYQQSGMLHVLAVSGLHVSMIAMILLWLFSRLPLSFVFSRVCVVILLIGYGIVAGFSVSCIRAILMIIIRIIAQILGRCYDDLSAISVAGIVILFMNPCKLFHCDFLLSFGAVLSISCLSPYIIELLSPPKLLNGLWEGACVSLSVTLFTTPVLLYFYYEVPLYSLLLNAVVLPFVPFLFILAILLPIASGIACILGYVLAGPIHYILVLYHYLFEWSGKFFVELRLIGGPSINNILIYIILTFVLIVLLRGLKEALIKRVILVCFVCVLFGVIDVPLRAGSLTVTFLDVGQGDGIHLQMPNGDDVMIDGGSSTIGSLSKYRLQPYLRYRGVRTIKYWFLTHMDLDHCSGLKELLESSGCAIVNIENIIIPDSEECRDEFDEIFGGLVEDISVLYMKRGDCMTLGDVTVQSLSPQKDKEYADRNEGSMVLAVEHIDIKWLFTGDVEGNAEEELQSIVDKEYDILKVAHHGSRNSSSDAFITKISPKISIISCGKNNRYGHPHKETVLNLSRANSIIFNTSISGAIQISSDGYECEINTFW